MIGAQSNNHDINLYRSCLDSIAPGAVFPQRRAGFFRVSLLRRQRRQGNSGWVEELSNDDLSEQGTL